MASHSRSDYFRLTCLLLATLSTMLSLAVLVAVGHSYQTYKTQKAANNPWWLPLWPGHFETTGTRAIIGAGASVTLLNLTYIVVSVAKLHLFARRVLNTLSAIVLSLASGLIALFSVVLVEILNGQTADTDTIQTWTCRFSKAMPGTTLIAGTSVAEMSNDKFKTLCAESRFGLWGMVAILILQGVMFVCAVAQWFTRGRPAADHHEMEGDRKTEFSF